MEEGSPKGIFSRLKNWFKRLWGSSEDIQKEIKDLVDSGEESGALSEVEGSLIEAVLGTREMVVREVMVPRTEAVILPLNMSTEELREHFVKTGFTRLPIYENSLDNVIGIAHAKDLLAHWGRDDLEIRELLRPAHYVPETKKIYELLREITQRKSHLVVVVDEYGGVAGLVTLEDILEELVGEILDEHDLEEPLVWEEEDGVIIADGRLPDEEVAERFSVELPPGRYDTVAGLITHLLGRLPKSGEVVHLGSLEMTVEEADNRRVHRVRLRKIPYDEAANESKA